LPACHFLAATLSFSVISSSSPSADNTIHAAASYANRWRADVSGQAAREEKGIFTPGGREDKHRDGISQKPGNGRTEELSADDRRRAEELKSTDRAVRAHEAAHMAAGGSLVTSGASYSYETGPDGQRYAVAGEVGIDTSKGRTPEETLARAQQIRAAALAPADPSGQDRAVAAAATKMAADARAEIARANVEKGPTGKPHEGGGDRSASFGQAIERSLNPNGQAVNIYA
jgi:hypothetical protein